MTDVNTPKYQISVYEAAISVLIWSRVWGGMMPDFDYIAGSFVGTKITYCIPRPSSPRVRSKWGEIVIQAFSIVIAVIQVAQNDLIDDIQQGVACCVPAYVGTCRNSIQSCIRNIGHTCIRNRLIDGQHLILKYIDYRWTRWVSRSGSRMTCKCYVMKLFFCCL